MLCRAYHLNYAVLILHTYISYIAKSRGWQVSQRVYGTPCTSAQLPPGATILQYRKFHSETLGIFVIRSFYIFVSSKKDCDFFPMVYSLLNIPLVYPEQFKIYIFPPIIVR